MADPIPQPASAAPSDEPACARGPEGPAPGRVCLTQLRPGQTGTISGCNLPDDDRDLLRAMGLRDHAKVVLCRLGEPCIVRVMGGCGCSSRIGLSRPLADRVFVGPIEESH